MVKGSPYLSMLARAIVTCLIMAGLGVASQSVSPKEHAAVGKTANPIAADAVAGALALSREPEVLAIPPVATKSPTPLPITPTPTPAPVPHWAEAAVDTPLRVDPNPSAVAIQFLPRRSALRVLGSGGEFIRVYYGGNGDDRDPAEGWVSAADVALGTAPRWVETRRGTPLWSGLSRKESAGFLPERAVAEVLEESGNMVRLFYLGDGFSREQAEGWAEADSLVPAGPMLISERHGLRLLTREQVKSIEAGNGVWLRVPFRTQLDGSTSAGANCGPSSVAMALQFFRLAVPTGDVRNLADKLQGTADPDGGFQIEFLASAVERFGMKDLDLSAGAELVRQWTLGDLRRHVSEGHPVIAQLRFKEMPGRETAIYGEDHFVVIDGVLGDDFVYNDPVDVDGPGYGRVMSVDDLKRAWSNSYFPFAGFAVSAP